MQQTKYRLDERFFETLRIFQNVGGNILNHMKNKMIAD